MHEGIDLRGEAVPVCQGRLFGDMISVTYLEGAFYYFNRGLACFAMCSFRFVDMAEMVG